MDTWILDLFLSSLLNNRTNILRKTIKKNNSLDDSAFLCVDYKLCSLYCFWISSQTVFYIAGCF